MGRARDWADSTDGARELRPDTLGTHDTLARRAAGAGAGRGSGSWLLGSRERKLGTYFMTPLLVSAPCWPVLDCWLVLDCRLVLVHCCPAAAMFACSPLSC